MSTSHVSGVVVDASTGEARSGLVVELCRLRGNARRRIARAITQDDGSFSFAGRRDTAKTDRDGSITWETVRVLQGQTALFTTGARRWQPGASPPRLTLSVSVPSVAKDPGDPFSSTTPSAVHGVVRHRDGTPIPGASVQLFGYSLAGESAMGQAVTTGTDGSWTSSVQNASGDLFVRVGAPGAPSTEIGRSAVHVNAAVDERIDVRVATAGLGAPSRFDVLHNALGTTLDNSNTLNALDGPKVVYLAQKHAQIPTEVTWYVLARRLAAQVFGSQTSVTDYAILFALFSSGVRPTVVAIARLDAARVQSAVDAAVANTLIPASTSAAVPARVTAMHGQRTARSENTATPRSLGKMLETASGLTPQKRSAFISAWSTHAGTPEAFWAGLTGTLDASEIASAKITLQLGTLCVNHAPLVGAIRGSLGSAPLASLARRSTTDWTPTISGLGSDKTPPGVDGTDETARVANYATLLREQFELAFPGQATVGAIIRARAPADPLRQFLEADLTFDIETSDLSAVPQQHKDVLQQYQRAHRIAPRTNRGASAVAIHAAGFTSARAVVKLGAAAARSALVGAGLLAEEAEETVRRAVVQAGMSTAFALQNIPALRGPAMTVLPAADTTSTIPDYASLFGSLDGCACRHCRSVLSPAAYLYDLLEFIPSALRTALFGRRPDIEYVELSCENTDRTLPTIDIVNEVLENHLAGLLGLSRTSPVKTEGTEDDRRARPAYRNDASYTSLAAAQYPIALPFHRPLVEIRAMLGAAGVSRAALIRAWSEPSDPASAPTTLDTALDYERLRLFPAALNAVTASPVADQPWRWWGYADTESATWTADLAQVDALRRRGSVSFDEILDLLHSRVFNPGAAFEINDPTACDTASMAITDGTNPPGAASWGAARRFLRVARMLGTHLFDTDAIWAMLSLNGTLDAPGTTGVRRLSGLVRLGAMSGAPLVELAAMFAPAMDVVADRNTREEPLLSVYERTFLPRSLVADPFTSPFSIATVTNGASSGPTWANGQAHVAACLGIELDVASDLAAWFGIDDSTILRLATLSNLARVATLARAGKMSVRDALTLLQLRVHPTLYPTTVPTIFTTPLVTAAWLEDAEMTSILTSDELAWILAMEPAARDRVRPTDARLTEWLGAARRAVTATDAVVNDTLDNWVAETWGVDASIAAAILDTGMPTLRTVLTDATWLAPSAEDLSTGNDITTTTAALQFPAMERLAASIRLAQALGVQAADVATWTSSSTWFGPQDVVSTVTTTVSELQARFDRLAETARMFSWDRRVPGADEIPLTTVIASASTFVTQLVARTGWDEAALTALKAALTWTDTSLLGGRGLHRFLDAWEAVQKLGVEATAIPAWLSTDPLAADSDAAVTAARATQSSPEAWVALIRETADRLRQEQRGALLAAVMAVGAYDDVPAVFNDLLIDPLTEPINETSRLVQATAAVQLFIFRAMLGLEAGWDPTEEEREEWAWKKNYRLWEAARTVFLYPENWIDPSLRDDKSSFFKAAETQLQGADPTDENLDTVVSTYLDRLLEVSSLQVVGFCEETDEDDGTSTRLHVFARTRGSPARYWYRRLENDATWTAWERIEQEITSDHLIPVAYGGRLHLFWAAFGNSSYETEDSDGETIDKECWEIKLNWSEYRNGAWSAARVSEDAISTSYLANLRVDADAPTRRFRFTADLSSGSPVIRCDYIGDVWQSGDKLTNVEPSGPLSSSSTPAQELAVTNAVAALVSTGEEERTLLGTFSINPCSNAIELDEGSTSSSGDLDPIDMEDAWEGNSEGILLPENAGITAQGLKTRRSLNGSRLSVLYGGTVDASGSYDSEDPPEVLTLLGTAPAVTRLITSVHARDIVPGSLFFIDNKEHAFLVRATQASPESAADVTSLTPNNLGSVSARSSTFTLQRGKADKGAFDGTSPIISEDDSGTWSFSVVHDAAAGLAVGNIATYDVLVASERPTYGFESFYHPFACRFVQAVRRNGAFGLLNPSADGADFDLALQDPPSSWTFAGDYTPSADVSSTPTESIEFTRTSAFGSYNWEVFFHLPFRIATHLSGQGRFEDAIDWFHTLFDPRRGAADCWRFRPFTEVLDPPATQWEALLDATAEEQAAFTAIVEAWLEDPFNTDLLARLRTDVYPKATMMKYLDTLIAWADARFAVDTRESINEATQLYMLASQLLGDRPDQLPEVVHTSAQSYHRLSASASSSLGDLLIGVENAVFTVGEVSPRKLSKAMTGLARMDLGSTLYFQIPQNDRLLKYWDTVEDRLFKIRNSMNLEGEVRLLSLFAPPIDPGMLVKARAAGVDLSNMGEAPNLPPYRYSVVVQRAQALCGSVKAFGGALLAALEKQDNEALTLLRQEHEQTLLKAVRSTKKDAVREAKEQLRAVKAQIKTAERRRDHYQKLFDQWVLPEETKQDQLGDEASTYQMIGQALSATTAPSSLIPQSLLSVPPAVEFGGQQIAGMFNAMAGAATMLASELTRQSSKQGTIAMRKRRGQDWSLQIDQAKSELKQLARQLAAAEIREEMAKNELDNHDLQREQSAAVEAWMRSRFTRQELHTWMATQLATLHYSAYKLAFDMAKKAEVCWQREVGDSTQTFVQWGHWDGIRKGLLAGEKLSADLDRMEAAWIEKDARRFEVTKRVSLSEISPSSLLTLQEDGTCSFSIPTAWLEVDHGAQSWRYLRGLTLSVPCTAGPSTGATGFLGVAGGDDIALSGIADDSGVLQFNLGDAKYLPFEGNDPTSGAWTLTLSGAAGGPGKQRFDWTTISDVVLTLRYAFDRSTTGGTELGEQHVLLSVRRDAPDAWESVSSWTAGSLTINLAPGMVPYFARGLAPAAAAGAITIRGTWSATVTDPPDVTGTFTDGTVTIEWTAGSGQPDDILILLSYTVPSTP